MKNKNSAWRMNMPPEGSENITQSNVSPNFLSKKQRILIVRVFLFFVVWGAYLSNGDYLHGNDTTGTIYTAVNLMHKGTFILSPCDYPFMFFFDGISTETLNEHCRSNSWSVLKDKVYPKYYLLPVVGEPGYINSFGSGASLTALPFLWVFDFLGFDLAGNADTLFMTTKWVSSLLVALTVLLLFEVALLFLGIGASAILAFSIALGTSLFGTSSQALWQHGPNIFYLSLGVFFLFKFRTNLGATLVGLAFSLATLCRPTSIIFIVSMAVYWLLTDRRKLFFLGAGALPALASLAFFNYYFLGAFYSFPQSLLGANLALLKTGSPDVWQTPLWEGLAGLLFSPNRGLFIFSPILLLSLLGIRALIKDERMRMAIPLMMSQLIIVLFESKHFDWWGGWSFGCRHLSDSVVVFFIMAIPAVAIVKRSMVLTVCFACALLFSVGVQVLGAFSYDLSGWNNKARYIIRFDGEERLSAVEDDYLLEKILKTPDAHLAGIQYMDIDKPEFRYRIWSVSDSQIVYHLANFTESRKRKKQSIPPGTEMKNAYRK